MSNSFGQFHPPKLNDLEDWGTLSQRLYKSRTMFFEFSKELESTFGNSIYQMNNLVISMRAIAEQERQLQTYVDMYAWEKTASEWAAHIKEDGYVDELEIVLSNYGTATDNYTKNLISVTAFCASEILK